MYKDHVQKFVLNIIFGNLDEKRTSTVFNSLLNCENQKQFDTVIENEEITYKHAFGEHTRRTLQDLMNSLATTVEVTYETRE